MSWLHCSGQQHPARHCRRRCVCRLQAPASPARAHLFVPPTRPHAVRGAYMVLERARAEERGYPSPILDTIEDTHANYDA